MSLQYLKLKYPDYTSLKNHAELLFSQHCELTIIKGELLPKDFKKKYGKHSLSECNYSEILKIVDEYSNICVPKKSDGKVHTINEFKSEPFRIEHNYVNSQDNDNYKYIIASLLIFIVIIIIIFCIYKFKTRNNNI
jgi:hypothetical protein